MSISCLRIDRTARRELDNFPDLNGLTFVDNVTIRRASSSGSAWRRKGVSTTVERPSRPRNPWSDTILRASTGDTRMAATIPGPLIMQAMGHRRRVGEFSV
jgi:hypothetical protein